MTLPHLQSAGVATTGAILAVAGIADEHMAALIAVGVIVAGYAWLERRMEQIVRREMEAHNAVEGEWRKGLTTMVEGLQRELRKQNGEG